MKKYKFYDEVEVYSGGTPSTKIKKYWNGEIPWVSIADIGYGRYISDTSKKITDLGVSNSPANLSSEGDILITARGTVGKLAVLNEGMTFNQSCFGIRSKGNNIVQLFLYYYLKFYVPYTVSMSHGSVFSTINRNTFNFFDIKAPDLNEQKRIAKLLNTFDEKIESNYLMIEVINNYLSTLYNYWFTQFDFPDEKGNPYKTSGGKMVYDEKLKKEIPQGWEVQTLLKNDVSDIVSGGVEKFEGEKEYLATADIDETGALNGELINFDDRPNRANMSPIANSIWVAKMADSPKRLFFTEESNSINQYIISTGMFAFTSSKENFEYLMMYLFSDLFENLKDRFAQGATQRAINQENLALFPIIIPEEKIINKFHYFSKDIVRKIELLKEENIELKKQRDFLLPLLMNGQVKIK